MKTIKHNLCIVLFFMSTIINAQETTNSPKVEEMHTRKWNFLVEQAQLTQNELDAVQTIFMEYEKSVWSLHQQNREFFKKSIKELRNDKPNYTEMNDRYVEFEVKQSQLFKNYHMQLRKVLQPETLFKYYKAEREFKRKLLKDMQGRNLRGDRP